MRLDRHVEARITLGNVPTSNDRHLLRGEHPLYPAVEYLPGLFLQPLQGLPK